MINEDVSVVLARLDERSENTEKQLKVNSNIIYELKEKQVQACTAIEYMQERYENHLEKSHETDQKLEAFILDYERIKAKGGAILVLTGVVVMAIWQGAFNWITWKH